MDCLTLDDETNKLFRNVSNQLPTCAALTYKNLVMSPKKALDSMKDCLAARQPHRDSDSNIREERSSELPLDRNLKNLAQWKVT